MMDMHPIMDLELSTSSMLHSLPAGEARPLQNQHALTASMPTWDSVIAWMTGQPWMVQKMQTAYPRFCLYPIIQQLSREVLLRLQNASNETGCMAFPTEGGASRCLAALKIDNANKPQSEIVRFALPNAPQSSEFGDASWAGFHAVLSLRTQPLKSDIKANESSLPPIKSASVEELGVQSIIAELATSGKAGQQPVNSRDVFLYPNGMSAIYAVARALASLSDKPDAAVYGFVYAETINAIRRGGFDGHTFYGRGTAQELDEFESELMAGRRVQALFCELPSNPQLTSPDLHRIRTLADKYNFMVACDETVGTFVNVDLLPYADMLITSLTKTFSGASDVMGARLTAQYEQTYFPGDVCTLMRNCVSFVPRVLRSNETAEAVAHLFLKHPSVAELYYPSIGSRKTAFERYRRKGGGYGNLMSVIFREPHSAICFYDALDVFKGPSFGTNFTLAIPYVQLAFQHKQDWVASYGIPKHLVRLSIGLEEKSQIMERISSALTHVEKFEGKNVNARASK